MSSSSSSSSLMPPPPTTTSGGVAVLPNNLLYVHEVQRGNPLLAYVKNVKWAYSKDIIPDYVMQATCALFVSVKYHHRHPKHIIRRIDEVGRNYRLRVLLVLVDDEHNLPVLQDLNRIAFISNFTLIYTWSNQEAARYLETWKAFEQKSSVSIQAKEETEFLPRLSRVLTSVRSVNKTDVTTLLDVFGNFTNICHAEDQQLILCPGMGEKKVKRLFQALHVSFQPKASSMQKKNKLSATYEHAKQQASKLKEDVVEEEVVELNEEVEEVDGERESKRSRIITAIDLIEDNEEDKLDQK